MPFRGRHVELGQPSSDTWQHPLSCQLSSPHTHILPGLTLQHQSSVTTPSARSKLLHTPSLFCLNKCTNQTSRAGQQGMCSSATDLPSPWAYRLTVWNCRWFKRVAQTLLYVVHRCLHFGLSKGVFPCPLADKPAVPQLLLSTLSPLQYPNHTTLIQYWVADSAAGGGALPVMTEVKASQSSGRSSMTSPPRRRPSAEVMGAQMLGASSSQSLLRQSPTCPPLS